ncbi:hypothetical protein L3Q82_009519 [Scortum barcoo]|uniref:Uncharacterized protein n=1 Tax=Scortum barcoo TaxID=214431 RepID=A0ACB8WHC4_9TELE|nr:hypothetical protein L3Q82_009519 [Scortum barcoo]
MSRKQPDHDYSLRSMSNLMGERWKKVNDGGERSLIKAPSSASISSQGASSSSSAAAAASSTAGAPAAPSSSTGDLERAARKQFQQDVTPGFVYVLAAFSALGGFLFGYDTGVISGAMLLLKRELDLSALWQELLISSTVAAAALSALLGGFLNGLFGRRVCILLASFFFTAGGIVLSTAPGKEALLAGRLIVGVGLVAAVAHESLSLSKELLNRALLAEHRVDGTRPPPPLRVERRDCWELSLVLKGELINEKGSTVAPCINISCSVSLGDIWAVCGSRRGSDGDKLLRHRHGIASMTVPVYIAEASPPHLRGQLVTVNTLFITGGQFTASLIDGAFSYLQRDGWRYMLGLSVVPAVLQFIGFLFLPESPRWLIQRGLTQKARRVLSQIRGNQNIDEEYDSIKNSIDEEDSGGGNSRKKEGGSTDILRPTYDLEMGCRLATRQTDRQMERTESSDSK